MSVACARADVPRAHAVAAPWGVAEPLVPYRVDGPLEWLHHLAMALAAGRACLALPLARVAAALVGRGAHHEFGFARLDDYARERHGRSGRWIRDLAVLEGYFQKVPGLAAAVAGDDGGAPLHISAAMAIGAAAGGSAVGTDAARWIARGREVALARLKREMRPGSETDDDAEASRVKLKLPVPPAVGAAFDETLDLHRAIVGSETSVTSFVVAMVAETLTEPGALGEAGAEGLADPLMTGADRAVREEAREKAAGGWAGLPRSGGGCWALRLAGSSLRKLEDLKQTAGTGDARQLDEQLGALLGLDNVLELRLGEVLLEMSRMEAWKRLGFEDAGHYAERMLRMSRTAAEDRMWVAAGVRRFALVRQAYEKGELSWEATRCVLRLMRGTGATELEAQREWVEHGKVCTVKRLRDEAKARRREAVLEGRSGPVKPMSDEAWHASVRREPGTATQRMARFGAMLVEEAGRRQAGGAGSGGAAMEREVLRLSLPPRVAGDLLRVVRAKRDALVRGAQAGQATQAEHVTQGTQAPAGDAPAAPASVLLTRTFSTGGRPVPLWVGLLGLLEDCVRQWDPVKANVGGPDRRELFARSGYRCSAPGCMGRESLQDHHIVFLSEGGGSELTNRTSLCWFHHHPGIHRGLATARGEAPLNVTWQLGRDGQGGQFRNERRV